MSIKVLLQNIFSIGSVSIFLISAFILLFIDCKDYKKSGLKREYNISKFFGILFLIGSTGMYIIMKFIVK